MRGRGMFSVLSRNKKWKSALQWASWKWKSGGRWALWSFSPQLPRGEKVFITPLFKTDTTEETEKKKHTSAIFLPPRNRFFVRKHTYHPLFILPTKVCYKEFSLVSGVLFWVLWHPFKLRFCPTQTVRSSCLVLWRTNMNGAKFRWIFISTRGEWHIWIRRRVKSPKSVRSPPNLCSLYNEYCCVQLWIKTNSRTMSTWIHSSLR